MKARSTGGNVTIWIDEAVLARMPDAIPTRGRSCLYGDTLTQALLGVKTLYRLTLRALQGFTQSLRDLDFPSLPVPNYTTLCRREKRSIYATNALRRRGWTYDEIAEHTNLWRTGVFDICKRYAREGVAGLRDKTSVGAVNPRRALSEQQEVEIRALFLDQMPDQLKMSFALWTRHAVRELIRQQCGLTLTLHGFGLYLAR
ncbi:MAG: hypothetical protein E5299_00127 [Burkholderia gladioli]|nr:MAG: hypothetical protein E5299_00127 [Burkholderia gladioli]